MAVTLEQFLRELTDSGLMTSDEVAEFRGLLPDEKQSPDDAQMVARELVKQKKLTKFQVEQIYSGKGKSLTLGNYVILDKLGQGGMGMVLKAKHKRMGRIVALKVMSPAAVKSPDAVKRFHREVQTAAKLTHPNIVTAFDADEARETHFLVMEYVEGDDLSQLVKKHGVMSVEQAIECVIQAARGLAHAHAEGVIHRDIKPANLLMKVEGLGSMVEGEGSSKPSTFNPQPLTFTIKILDMGLARLESGLADAGAVSSAGLTQSGTIMGTVDYMSPEQAEDTRHADARADIYSLGCSLFYLLTGQAVYGGETMMKKLLAHRDAALPSLEGLMVDGRKLREGQTQAGSTINHQLSTLNQVFHKMIAKRTSDRYQSMAEVIADLERCRAGQSVTVNVSAVSGESGSSNELQNFLRQISGESGSEFTSATASPQGAGPRPVGHAEETMLLAANGSGTDPQTEMSLATERLMSTSRSTRNALLAVVGVCLLLLGTLWLLRTPRGSMLIEITDEKIAVTVGESGEPLRGKQEETLRLPVGEHVLHVQVGETNWDTPEIAVVKGETVELKVERVGNRVRVMRDGEFFVAKELPRSKASGEKAASLSAPNYALKFDGQSFVEIPSLKWNGTDPVTMEFVISVDDAEAAVAGASVIASWLSPKAETELMVYRVSNIWAFDWRHLAKRWISALPSVRPNERVLLTCRWDGKQTSISANAEQANAFEDTTIPGTGRPGLWIGGSDAHANTNQLFRGTIEQVRISKGVRTALPGVPAGRLPKEKSTLALYHFDEGRGSVLKDSSGNNHHGKITGAKWVRVEPAPPPGDYALEFDFNAPSSVKCETLKLGVHEPFTIEGMMNVPTGQNFAYPLMLVDAPASVLINHNQIWQQHVLDGVVQEGTKTDFVRGRRGHVAWVGTGKELLLFVDGRLIGRHTPAKPFKSDPYAFVMGARLSGTMDEVRVSKTARYLEDFSPAGRHEPDADTWALYHFDEGTGDVLKDSSGNNHHGQITGAKWVNTDGTAIKPNASPSIGPPAFVLTRNKQRVGAFQTLAEAFEQLGQDNVIEIHGNGPFAVGNLKTEGKNSLTLKSAPGYRARFTPTDPSFKPGDYVFHMAVVDSLQVEGIDFISNVPCDWFAGHGKQWDFQNCRIVNLNAKTPVGLRFGGSKLRLEDCLLILVENGGGLILTGRDAQQVEMINCVCFMQPSRPIYSCYYYDEFDHSLRLERNTMFAPLHLGFNKTTNRKALSIEASGNLFGQTAVMIGDGFDMSEIHWKGRGNVYFDSTGVAMSRAEPTQPFMQLSLKSWISDQKRDEQDSREVNAVVPQWSDLATTDPDQFAGRVLDLAKKLHTTHKAGADVSKWPVGVDAAVQTGDSDRRAAAYILSIGGTVQINEIPQEYTDVRELPKSKFRLTSISVQNSQQVSDTGLAACRDCQFLTQLWLSNVSIGDTGLEPFRRCKTLTVLKLQGTNATDVGLAYFSGCRDLNYLGLAEPQVTDLGLAIFKDCTKLESLSLTGTQVTDKGIGSLQDCRNLQSVYIHIAPMGDAALAQLKSFPKLNHLTFAATQATNAGLASLQNLQPLTSLNLGSTPQLDDASVEHLKKLTNLTDLSLLQTKLTSAGIAELKKALPNCKIESDIKP